MHVVAGGQDKNTQNRAGKRLEEGEDVAEPNLRDDGMQEESALVLLGAVVGGRGRGGGQERRGGWGEIAFLKRNRKPTTPRTNSSWE